MGDPTSGFPSSTILGRVGEEKRALQPPTPTPSMPAPACCGPPNSDQVTFHPLCCYGNHFTSASLNCQRCWDTEGREMDGVEQRRSCPIRGSEYLAEPEDGSTWGGRSFFWQDLCLGCGWKKSTPGLGGPTAHLTFSSWVWLSQPPGPLRTLLSGFWNLPIQLLIFLPLCWSRPLSNLFSQ